MAAQPDPTVAAAGVMTMPGGGAMPVVVPAGAQQAAQATLMQATPTGMQAAQRPVVAGTGMQAQPQHPRWKQGDQCFAKYYHDNKVPLALCRKKKIIVFG